MSERFRFGTHYNILIKELKVSVESAFLLDPRHKNLNREKIENVKNIFARLSKLLFKALKKHEKG